MIIPTDPSLYLRVKRAVGAEKLFGIPSLFHLILVINYTTLRHLVVPDNGIWSWSAYNYSSDNDVLKVTE